MEMENKTAGLLWIYLNQTFNAEKKQKSALSLNK